MLFLTGGILKRHSSDQKAQEEQRKKVKGKFFISNVVLEAMEDLFAHLSHTLEVSYCDGRQSAVHPSVSLSIQYLQQFL